ncbi:hypothetical protein HY384_03125 [Candidatus Daviesbacteria bacterium]|nr:hypothetical protein [Candidatus Daviesbacteria bacterium]
MNETETNNLQNPKIINAVTNSQGKFLKIGFLIALITLSIIGFLVFRKGFLKTQAPEPSKSKFVVNPDLQKGPFVCPVADFCNFTATSSSASGKLAKNSKIYASFDGDVKILSRPNDDLTVLSLANDVRGIRANYYFVGGEVTKLPSIKEGGLIATISREPSTQLNGGNFKFVLFNRLTDEGWKVANFSAADFVK